MKTVTFKFKGHLIEASGDTDGNQFDIDNIEYLGDDPTDFYYSIMDTKAGKLEELAVIAYNENEGERVADTMDELNPWAKGYRR